LNNKKLINSQLIAPKNSGKKLSKSARSEDKTREKGTRQISLLPRRRKRKSQREKKLLLKELRGSRGPSQFKANSLLRRRMKLRKKRKQV